MNEILEKIRPLVGTEIGVGDWLTITQERVDAFADATDDHQWIHVDRRRAAQGPYGTTIAHGFLTLSLVVALTAGLEFDVGQPRMGINYGLDRVRFISPVPSGSRIRARVELLAADEVEAGIQLKRKVTIELEGNDRPAMVAETLARYIY